VKFWGVLSPVAEELTPNRAMDVPSWSSQKAVEIPHAKDAKVGKGWAIGEKLISGILQVQVSAFATILSPP
jgi:hypothetical protein